MSAVTSRAAEYRTACAELAILNDEVTQARAKLDELEEKQRKASMRRNEAQRMLLEEAKR